MEVWSNDTFQWESAYLNGFIWPLSAAVLYICTVVFLRSTIRHNRFAISVAPIQISHNLFLSLGSAGLAMYTGILLYKRWTVEGGMFFLCENMRQTSGGLYFCSYIYYLSKYYELFDTILQLLKGRDPPNLFFGVYHHSLVLFMSWFWLEYRQSTQFIGLVWNCFVHTIMYFYYFLLGVTGRPPVWKSLVTSVQIVQFIFSLMVLVGYVIVYSTGYDCSGHYALVFNALFNITLLYQFVGIKSRSHAQSRKFA